MCSKFVQVPFEKCLEVFNGIQNRRLCRPLKELKWLYDLVHVLGTIIMLKDQPTWIQIIIFYSGLQEIF